MATETIILLMFVIASAVAIAARRFGIPYTVALVPVGLLLSAMHLLNPPLLTRPRFISISRAYGGIGPPCWHWPFPE